MGNGRRSAYRRWHQTPISAKLGVWDYSKNPITGVLKAINLRKFRKMATTQTPTARTRQRGMVGKRPTDLVEESNKPFPNLGARGGSGSKNPVRGMVRELRKMATTHDPNLVARRGGWDYRQKPCTGHGQRKTYGSFGRWQQPRPPISEGGAECPTSLVGSFHRLR